MPWYQRIIEIPASPWASTRQYSTEEWLVTTYLAAGTAATSSDLGYKSMHSNLQTAANSAALMSPYSRPVSRGESGFTSIV